MQLLNLNNFDLCLSSFRRHFDLTARLPEIVFKANNRNKFVIGESGDFHKMEVFARLGAEYYETELNYFMIEPKAKDIFQTENEFLAYVLPFGSEFETAWKDELFGFAQPQNKVKSWPWMIAGLQCYFGSSGKWNSYHDNHTFELDIFSVPNDCDVLKVFGKPSWRLEDYIEAVDLHNIGVDAADIRKLQKYYFDFTG